MGRQSKRKQQQGGSRLKLGEVVTQFLLDRELRGCTSRSINWYKQKLGYFVQVMVEEYKVLYLEPLTLAHLRQFIHLLLNTEADANNPHKPTQKGKLLSPRTVQGYVLALKAFFHWCVDEDLIGSSPATRLVLPKAPAYLVPTLEPEHIEKMLASCNLRTPLGFRDYVLLLVLLDTGMRVSELRGLQVGDVHERYVKVFGKGRKEREIGIHPEVSKLLWKYIHKYRHPKQPGETKVFLGRGGLPLSMSGVHAILVHAKHAAGISEEMRVSAHVFRHTFAKMYLEQGGELFKLSREMGHSKVQVTEVYLKDFNSTEARQEHDEFSPVVGLNLKKNRFAKPKRNE